jgi:hypothetical protein
MMAQAVVEPPSRNFLIVFHIIFKYNPTYFFIYISNLFDRANTPGTLFREVFV